MTTKAQRWFEVIGNDLHIYDTPYKANSGSVSIVDKSYFPYYRSNFNLQVIWG